MNFDDLVSIVKEHTITRSQTIKTNPALAEKEIQEYLDSINLNNYSYLPFNFGNITITYYPNRDKFTYILNGRYRVQLQRSGYPRYNYAKSTFDGINKFVPRKQLLRLITNLSRIDNDIIKSGMESMFSSDPSTETSNKVDIEPHDLPTRFMRNLKRNAYNARQGANFIKGIYKKGKDYFTKKKDT